MSRLVSTWWSNTLAKYQDLLVCSRTQCVLELFYTMKETRVFVSSSKPRQFFGMLRHSKV